MKQSLYRLIESIKEQLWEMSDTIFDHPELGLEEVLASDLLCGWLETNGFSVQRGVGGLPTAFRAEYSRGEGGPSIGLLCEYDALVGIGHACGHQLQGPCILGAANALRQMEGNLPFRVVVYGTPAEETSGGKIAMLENGCFEDIDVALMMHAGPETTTDIKSLANLSLRVIYRGISTHAALKPEAGRSAVDAMLLAFQGTEFLREHVRDDVRMHYAIVDCGSRPANVVPDYACADFLLRSYNTDYLNDVLRRMRLVLEGAAMMTETQVEVELRKSIAAKIPVLSLNDLIMENARAVDAPVIRPPRQKTGSTDLGNVMQKLPGSCIRVAFVPEGTSSHSQTYVDAGKSEAAHTAILVGAKVLAGTALDLIERPTLLAEIQQEFMRNRNAQKSGC